MNISTEDTPVINTPRSVEEVIGTLMWEGWDQSISFYEGSKYCTKIDANLIRGTIRELRKRKSLPRYVCALSKVVRVSESDSSVEACWRDAIRDLRILFHASPIGTERQRKLLVSVSKNTALVRAMRQALQKEKNIIRRSIEPTWIAVLYAEGSSASLKEANRFNNLLNPELQDRLRGYKCA